ncbi:MAG: hypothetical protein R3B07_20500 [Polyangiaceae bacterium]
MSSDKLRSGPGVARLIARRITEHEFEYREAGRSLRAIYDPRETDVHCLVSTHTWTGGEEITAEERQRIYEGLWGLSQQYGARSLIEEVGRFGLCLPVRWNRGPDGCLINIHDAGVIQLMKLGRVLRLEYVRREPFHDIRVVMEPDVCWTLPTGLRIPRPEHDQLVVALRRCDNADLWIGKGRPWRVQVADSALAL